MLNINENGHAEKILQRLNSMRQEEKNCDCVISAEGKEIYVNKDVMRAASDYFDAMFSHDTKEKQEGVVEMKDVQFSAVEKCIDFIYSGKLIASEDECEELLFCASLMQLNEVCDKISPFLEKQLSLESFFKTKKIAVKFSLSTLNSVCDKFALDHLFLLAMEEGFSNLNVEYVSFLLSSKKSSDQETEDTKLKIALQWINDDLDMREGYLMTFVKLLETTKLTVEYVSLLVKTEPLCMKYPEFMKELFIGITHPRNVGVGNLSNMTSVPISPLYVDADSSRMTNASSPFGAMVTSIMQQPKMTSFANALYVFDESEHLLRLYKPSQDQLTAIKSYRCAMETKCHFTACLFQEYLYIFHRSRNVYRLQIGQTSTWEQVADLLHDHEDGLQCTACENCIYVGGRHRMERYQVGGNDAWENIALDGNICHHSAFVSYEGCVFLIGGKCRGISVNNAAKLYNLSATWKSLPEINVARQDASATVFDGKIFVAGGRSRGEKLCDFEMYDSVINLWTILPKMSSPRYLFRLGVVDDHIFAVGNATEECSIEVYDSQMKKWLHYHDCPEMKIWAHATVMTYIA